MILDEVRRTHVEKLGWGRKSVTPIADWAFHTTIRFTRIDLETLLPGRFELPFAASETAALSIELREQIKVG